MAAETSPVRLPAGDDVLTVVAISLVAEILGDVLHEGLGHAAVALLTGAKSGVLSTVAWSSEFDSRLVAAGGTLANLAAGLVCWIVLRGVTCGSLRLRFFPAHKSCVQSLCWHRVFFLFWRDEFRRLGRRH